MSRINELRRALGLTLQEFADALGVSIGLVKQWQTHKESITVSRKYAICQRFGVSPEWLDTGAGDMFEPKKSLEEMKADYLCELFDALPEEKQTVIIAAMRRKLRELGIPDPTATTTKTQTNNGNIGGDMIQK